MALIDAVKTLHTSMLDTRAAYETASAEAEEPNLKSLFDEMVALRYKHHEQLHRVLTAAGEEPDESGSFMSNVHRTVIAVRSAIKGIDRDALSSFASGEENILKQYDEALAQDDIRPETLELLTRQKAALLEKIAEMEALARA